MNLRIGALGRLLAPGYSWCLHCGTPWRFVRLHDTDYGGGHGCFPLCEKCWEELATPDQRLPYYKQLVQRWAMQGSPKSYAEWQRIESAVLRGG